MLFFSRKITYFFTSAHKYLIKDMKYLIQVPPKKTGIHSSYTHFVKEQHLLKNDQAESQKMKDLSQVWKTMSQQQKATYQKYVASQKQAYQKSKAEYQAKYVTPFKSTNPHALFVKHLYEDKKINVSQNATIQQYAKAVGERVKQKTPQQQAQFAQQAKKLKEERKKMIEAYTFPNRQYASQASFSKKNPTIKPEDRKRCYEEYELQWQLQVKKWLQDNKYDLSLDEFLELYNNRQSSKQTSNKEKKAPRQKQDISSSTFPKGYKVPSLGGSVRRKSVI